MDRKQRFSQLKRIVIKIGTSVLADAHLHFDHDFMAQLSEQVAQLRARGFEILIVSSGAIAAGRSELHLQRPKSLAEKQAAAAVGQIRLMNHYRDALSKKGFFAAQVLLTHGDFQSRKRFLNARQTLLKLLQLGAIPLINENDTTSVEEILVGDNDNLSALVSVLVDADLLVLLCDVDGVFSADPVQDPSAHFIKLVENVEDVMHLAQGTLNPGSTGGMKTKLQAAKHAGAYGIPTLITHGRKLQNWDEVFEGKEIGTLILPQTKLQGRKHWIAHTLKAQGKLLVDQGAVHAIMQEGKSLLPAGVSSVEGHFGPGDPVDVASPDGIPFARGLVSYGALEVERLRGKRSSDIESILGFKTQDEIIHRNHLVLLTREVL